VRADALKAVDQDLVKAGLLAAHKQTGGRQLERKLERNPRHFRLADVAANLSHQY
jgi:hypothetical protein